MKNLSEHLFRAVCVIFSVVMIVLSLLSSIELAAVNDEAAALEKELARLKTSNAVLQAEYENSISLEEIDTYATEVLGMQRCSPGQIIYVELPG